MVFQFHLLCLLIMFLLLIIYYIKKENFHNDNYIFRGILLTTYIMQLCYFCTYIIEQSGIKVIYFDKFYLMTIVLWFSLFSLYYGMALLKEKNKTKESRLKIKESKIIKYFSIIQIISLVIILLLRIESFDQVLYYHYIISFLIGIYLIIDGIILLKAKKILPKEKNIHFLILFITQVFIFALQEYNGQFPLMNAGMILVVLYSYLTLENIEQKEVKNLKLERDYALKQSIDKASFLKNLSHQIRTPLNTIDGFSQVILDSDNIEDIKNDVEDIRLASRDLIDVINGMIDLSIIESGNLKLIYENYNIYDTLESIIEITKSKMKDKEVKFITKIPDNIPQVLYGDSERFSQIVLNLLTNAVKYTNNGTITLEVESIKSSSICRLKVSVIDTGIGIDSKELNTIFEQKENGRLGLVISKHLTELMNGNIDVESDTNKGSTFTITIDQKIISEQVLEETSKKKILRYFKAKDKRILLVDDNKLNLKVASKLLQPYDVEIIEATSGKECLNILEKDTNFDLILMDDLMPEMSGTECLDILKKIERVDGFYIPVVVLTANAISGVREKYLDIGFEDYLAKPIDKYELHRILKKYLKEKSK